MRQGAGAVMLREARAADHDAVAGLWHASAALPGVGPRVMPTRTALRERLDRAVAEGCRLTVATEDSALLGFVAFRPDEAVLAELFVRPDALGRGIGRALLDHAKAAMPGGFTLFTRASNHRARSFYKREGLVALREASHPRSGDPVIHYGWGGAGHAARLPSRG